MLIISRKRHEKDKLNLLKIEYMICHSHKNSIIKITTVNYNINKNLNYHVES